MTTSPTATRISKEFTFDAWANRRLLAAMESAGGGTERMRDLMSHILGAQRVWLARLDGQPAPADAFTVRSAAECTAIQTVLEAAWVRWLAARGESDFAEVLRYTNLKGESFSNTVHDILTHVLSHGTYHRGQLASTLKAEGIAVPGTDRITFAREVG